MSPPKIDYGDEEQERQDLLRTGPGEQGAAVHLNITGHVRAQKLLKVNGFNAWVSDSISINRSVKDLRPAKCKSLKYDGLLPSVSIIVPFHDEHWSTLLRTAHSLLARAPARLVSELILVDDSSTKPFLGRMLDDYVAAHLAHTRVLRTRRREGLIRARLLGARAASGAVLVFIDSHCEAGYNWLAPLLEPIKTDYRTVTCPSIDVIGSDDFSIRIQDDGARGSFDWNFDYKRLSRLPGDKDHPEVPFDSPVMAGGLFAISSRWFWELGGYDSGLEVWGGEQYELSFKTWMCGGRMVDVPCSRVGHVFRQFNPFGVSGKGDYVMRNFKRVAEVWMDDWKRHLYARYAGRAERVEPGDLSEQKALRQRLHCSSFDWFLERVAFDLLKRYPVNESVLLAHGRVILKGDSRDHLCLRAGAGRVGDLVQLGACGPDHFQMSWRLSLQLANTTLCMYYSTNERSVRLTPCLADSDAQHWLYLPYSHQIRHPASDKCLEARPRAMTVFMDKCSSIISQKWTLDNMDEEMLRNRWERHMGW